MRINLIKPQPIRLTPAKARLIARLKGDGSIFVGGRRKTNYFLKYESANLQELEQFANDLKEVYNLKSKHELHRSGKKINKFLNVVFVRSKLAFMDMQRYGPFYSRTWRVPKEIKNSSKKIQKEFLSTFVEDEGSVILAKKEIRLYSINKIGLEDLSKLLKNFKIKTNIESGFGAGRNIYSLTINGKENLLAFKNFIGFRSQKRNQKLNELTSIL